MGGIYWLASYPKSGNTWFRSFLYNLQQNGDVPADINSLSFATVASNREWLDSVLCFDTADLLSDEVHRVRPSVYSWSSQEVIRYHKIHDAYTFNQDGEPLVSRQGTLGALYIIRNPLDVVSSWANHNSSTLDDAISDMGSAEFALARSTISLPDQVRQKLHSWSQHVCSWANAPKLNCLVIRYEDMLADSVNTFTQAAEFLQLPTEHESITKAIRFSDFKVLSQQEKEKGFKEKPSNAESFFRHGQSGGWRTQLSEAQVRQVINDHAEVMHRYGYLDDHRNPL